MNVSSISTTEAAEGANEEEAGSEETAVFPCPQGCICVFQRLSSLEKHLSLEACTKTLERQTLSDIAKVKYASLLQEGVAIPHIQPTTFTKDSIISSSSFSVEGWALRGTKKVYKFNEKQKEYLEAKFDIGQSTGRKINPEVVAIER